jgi:hypothetical protein
MVKTWNFLNPAVQKQNSSTHLDGDVYFDLYSEVYDLGIVRVRLE